MTGSSASRYSAFDPLPPLLPGAPHVWLCRDGSVSDEAIWKQYRNLLPATELRLCQSLPDPLRRRRAILSRVLLRTTLSRYAPVPPAHWAFDRDGFDKPRIAEPADTSLAFNISHSADWIACAVSREKAVGIDVQLCDPGRDVLRLAARFFSANETALLRTLTASGRCDRFYAYWTLKEAWLKTTGRGVSGGLDSICFELGENGCLSGFADPFDFPATFWSWQLEADYKLALCVQSDAPAPTPPVFRTRPLVDSEHLQLVPRHCGAAVLSRPSEESAKPGDVRHIFQ